jgi:hypothetical protein
MAKKKSKRKRSRGPKQRSYARLRRRLRQGPMDAYKLVADPKGQIKMSEVLEDFVEPYLEKVEDTLEAQTKLISVAVLAWNAALLPVEERREMLDDAVGKALKGASAKEKQGFREIVDTMIERKLAHFAEYGRAIIDFELTDIGSGYHLSVVSTMEGPGEPALTRQRHQAQEHGAPTTGSEP